MSKIINGINDIINDYDTFIIDQWGVMHDGKIGYQHAIDCIDILKKNNKNLIIISNSSKRKKNSIERLPVLGFNTDHFSEVLTSGEMIWQCILNSIDSYGINLENCYHIYDSTKEDGIDYRAGLNNISFVNQIEKADFILACTPYANSQPLDYLPLLKTASEKDLLMFCANPDFETVENTELKNIFCMGTIADLYDNIGGRVIILGKPSKEIYEEATKMIDNKLSKMVAIGDSLHHDILGAKNFGIDSVLITSGIHKNLFIDNKSIWLNQLNNKKMQGILPTYLCEKFSI